MRSRAVNKRQVVPDRLDLSPRPLLGCLFLPRRWVLRFDVHVGGDERFQVENVFAPQFAGVLVLRRLSNNLAHYALIALLDEFLDETLKEERDT